MRCKTLILVGFFFLGLFQGLRAQQSCFSAEYLPADQEMGFQYSGAGEHWLLTETQTTSWAFYFNNTERMEVDSMRVFRDDCSSLQLVGTAYPTLESEGMSFYADSLIPGEPIWVAIYAASATAGHPFNARFQSFSTPSFCQNLPNCQLLCNGSFDDNNSSAPWWAAAYTPDHFIGTPNSNITTLPRTGNGLFGIVSYIQGGQTPNLREGIQVKLENPVSKGHWVYGEMYVNFTPSVSYFSSITKLGYTDYLEMLFTNGSYTLSPSLPLNPPQAQITPLDAQGNSTIGWIDGSQWKKISGVFEVQASQVDHLTISNFRDDAFTVNHIGDPNSNVLYVLVDDVDSRELPGAGDNQLVCNTSSPVQLGTGFCQPTSGVTVSWSPTTGLSDPNIAQPTATVSQTTTYTMTATYKGITYNDQVTVTVSPTPDAVTTVDNCDINNNRDATIDIPNYNPANQYTLNSVNGFTYAGAALNGSQYNFFDISYINYKDVGTYTIDITGGPDAGCSIEGRIVKCCSGAPFALAQEAFSHRSDITNWNNQNFEVGDYFTFDEDVQIENSTFWMHPDAQIRIDANADVEFINCTFNVSDCNPPYKWDGIIVQANATALKLVECQVMDAFRGVYNPGHLTKVILNDNYFSENIMSVVLTNQSFSSGVLSNGTYTQIHGNRFDLSAPVNMGIPLHPNSTLDIQNFLPSVSFPNSTLGPVFTNPAVHILVDNVSAFTLGSTGSSPNSFEQHPNTNYKSVLNGGSQVLIANMENVQIFNNRFEMQDPHITFYRATAKVGGTGVNQGNTFDGFLSEDYRGIHALESSLDIVGNTFKGGASIYSRNATTDFHFGSSSPWHGNGSRVLGNTFRGGTEINAQGIEELFPSRVFAEIDPATAPHTHPTFYVINNSFKVGSRLKLKNFGSSQIFNLINPYFLPSRIYGNGFHGEGFNELNLVEDRAFISVLNSQDVIIAENNMDCSQPNQGGGGSEPGETPGGPGLGGVESNGSSTGGKNYFCSNGIGIYLRDCEDCQVNGNGNSPEPPISTNEPVKIGGEGIRLKGDVSGTQLHCNELDSNQVHIDLDQVTAWAHQISGSAGVDNVFTNVMGFDISGQLGTGANPLSYDYFITMGGANLSPSLNLSLGNISLQFGTGSNSCTAYSKYKNNPDESEDNSREEFTFMIYPNPTEKVLTLETEQPGEKAYLRTIDGKLVRQFIINKASQNLALGDLSPGMYLLQYNNNTQKVLIQ